MNVDIREQGKAQGCEKNRKIEKPKSKPKARNKKESKSKSNLNLSNKKTQ